MKYFRHTLEVNSPWSFVFLLCIIFLLLHITSYHKFGKLHILSSHSFCGLGVQAQCSWSCLVSHRAAAGVLTRSCSHRRLTWERICLQVFLGCWQNSCPCPAGPRAPDAFCPLAPGGCLQFSSWGFSQCACFFLQASEENLERIY